MYELGFPILRSREGSRQQMGRHASMFSMSRGTSNSSLSRWRPLRNFGQRRKNYSLSMG